jgi:Fe(3+) dicitrate transport protein
MKLRKRILFLFFTLLFIQIHVFAQISVTGKVIEEGNNEPLMGAQIVLDNGSRLKY